MPLPAALAEAINWVAQPLPLPIEQCATAPPPALPPAYLEFLSFVTPGEGFVGYEYLRLYPLNQLAWINSAYQVAQYLPGHLLFGSNGCGEAYLFGPPAPTRSVLQVAFVPLDLEYVSRTWPDFPSFLLALVSSPRLYEDSSYPDTPNPDVIGLEVHDVQPIALGGNPTDPANKVLLPVPRHAEAVRFWNRAFRIVKAGTEA